MQQIMSPEEWLKEKPELHALPLFHCMKQYAIYVSNYTRDYYLDLAAEKAEVWYDEDGYAEGVAKYSILSLKNNKDLQL
jgi:hypothetical protein